jgi:membrane fusion protein, copper/silver efflux system
MIKRGAIAAVLLAALGAGFLAGVWYNQRAGVSASALRGRRILYYVDPMHPGYRSDKPGIAPDCGMALEPIYADGDGRAAAAPAAAPGAIAISADKQALIGVEVRAVERGSRIEPLRLSGRVVVDETRSYRINVGIDGYVRDMSQATTGSRVTKDQWLATVSTPDLRTAAQAYLVSLDIVDRSRKSGDSQVQVDIATAGAQQAIDRLRTIGMSPLQIDEIARTRLVPANLRITAPADGIVVARHASIGQKVGNGDEVYRIADLGRVWVMADAYGADADAVAPGAAARVSIPGRGPSLPARVSRDVAPQFDRDSQSATVRLVVDNPAALLRPDMFVDVDVTVSSGPGISVPADAIVDSGLKRTVFVERSAGVFEARDVETGRRSRGRVDIVRGLRAGERIVVAGAFIVDAERRLRTPVPSDRTRP